MKPDIARKTQTVVGCYAVSSLHSFQVLVKPFVYKNWIFRKLIKRVKMKLLLQPSQWKLLTLGNKDFDICAFFVCFSSFSNQTKTTPVFFSAKCGLLIRFFLIYHLSLNYKKMHLCSWGSFLLWTYYDSDCCLIYLYSSFKYVPTGYVFLNVVLALSLVITRRGKNVYPSCSQINLKLSWGPRR